MNAQHQLDAFERNLDRYNFRLCVKAYVAVFATAAVMFFVHF